MLDVLVPACLGIVMFVLGLDLEADDFRRIVRSPRAVVAGTIGQIVLLPLLAIGLVRVTHPPIGAAAGLLLLATCPGGALSNFCVHLARASTALSVSLTAVSTILSIATVPILLALWMPFVEEGGSTPSVPVFRMALQFVLLVLLPIGLGMGLRRRKPALAESLIPSGNLLGIACVVLIVVLIATEQWEALMRDLRVTASLAVVYCLLAMAAGVATGRVLGLSAADRFTYLIEFLTRNYVFALLVGATLLERAEILSIVLTFFVIQTVIAFAAVGIYRARRYCPAQRGSPQLASGAERV